jgi:hypothetical protein
MRFPVLLTALVASAPCWAVLGGPPSTSGPGVQASAAQTASGASYTDFQSQLPSGTVVHEFADASGTVFAVAWSGPFQPDLKALLGPWFDTFTAQASQRKGNDHSRLAVQSDDLVVVSTGRMGAFQGRAWLASKLPAGFSTDQMR